VVKDISWFHVVPVGTSLLQNFERKHAKLAEELGVKGWAKASPDDHKVQSRAYRCSISPNRVFRELHDFLSVDPKGNSAELNAFLKYVSLKNQGPPRRIGVMLYSTDTGTGYLCTKVIHKFLSSKGYVMVYQNRPIRVKGLGRSMYTFEDGLVNLLDTFTKHVLPLLRRGVKVYVNATAGFKAESAFLVLASTLLDVSRVYYIHESFHDVVELPIPKLKLDSKLEKLIRETVRSYGLKVSISEFEKLTLKYGFTVEDLKDKGIVDVTDHVELKNWILKMILQSKGLNR